MFARLIMLLNFCRIVQYRNNGPKYDGIFLTCEQFCGHTDISNRAHDLLSNASDFLFVVVVQYLNISGSLFFPIISTFSPLGLFYEFITTFYPM